MSYIHLCFGLPAKSTIANHTILNRLLLKRGSSSTATTCHLGNNLNLPTSKTPTSLTQHHQHHQYSVRTIGLYRRFEHFKQKLCLLTSSIATTFTTSKPLWTWHRSRQPDFTQTVEEFIPNSKSDLSKVEIFRVSNMKEQVDFGIIFDIDGVIGRGANPFIASKRMIKLLTDKDGHLMVPISFCTNSIGLASDKANLLSNWLDVEIKPEQMVGAHGPLSVFDKFHNKRVLFVGQGKIHEMAEELGFTNIVTIDEVKEAFPLLDIVDHGNRHYIAKHGITRSHSQDVFKPIEAIILIGEPVKWESHLQLLVDLLLTGGHPSFAPEDGIPKQHIPILACNMDLVFMAEACMPRFGHGAFLVCLESLYKKITGRDLQYTALVGKPSEITLRYSEHCISRHAAQLGIGKPIKTLYLIGDNPEVDVFGANLYNRYIEECLQNENSGLPHASRQVPADYQFTPQTAIKCNSVLVGTGVYDPKIGRIEDQEYDVYHHGHRDFETNQQLRIPSMYCSDVYDAVLSILEKELGVSDHLNNNEKKDNPELSPQ